MANPQKEYGYTAIANEIIEALARTRITSEARRILDLIFRKTYGFNKTQDCISLSQFCLGTGLKKNGICRSLKILELRKFILKHETPKGNMYRFNKDFQQWIPFSKERHVSNERMGVLKRENNRSQTRDIQKTVSKDTITKDIYSEQVAEILKIFYETVNPTLNWGNKTTRKAAEDIIKKFGFEETIKLTKFAVSVQGEKFAPVITTPYQLKEKLGALKIYADKNVGSNVAIIN